MTASFIYDITHWRKAFTAYEGVSLRYAWLVPAGALVFGICLCAICENMKMIVNAVMPALYLSLFIAIVLLCQRYMTIRWFKKQPLANKRVSGTFEDSKFVFEWESERVEWDWRTFLSAVIFKDGIALSSHSRSFISVAASGFASSQDFITACELVKSKVSKTKDLR